MDHYFKTIYLHLLASDSVTHGSIHMAKVSHAKEIANSSGYAAFAIIRSLRS
jgi:hypothetical protein